MPDSRRLQALWRQGVTLLGSERAILGGAMSWVSERHLVSALCNAGAFGVLAASAMPPEALDAEITATRALTHQPFGVNLILMHPALDALIEVCAQQQVSHVVLAGGIPRGETIARVKAFGAKVLCFAPSLLIGRKLVRLGADALILEGMEAGGHIGSVSTSVLAQEILPAIRDVPIFVAGGIGRGEAIATYLEMGAAGVQLGTRFVCAEESIVHADMKQLFIRSQARDAVLSVQVDQEFPVIPVRALANKATQDFIRFQHAVIEDYRSGGIDKKQAMLHIEHFWAGALKRAVIDGDVENGSVMAGQSVGMVTRVEPVSHILAELVAQAEAQLARAEA